MSATSRSGFAAATAVALVTSTAIFARQIAWPSTYRIRLGVAVAGTTN